MRKSIKLLLILFTIPALLAGQSITIPEGAPVAPGGNILAGKASVMPHSGFAAIIARGSNFVPLVVKTDAVLNGNAGEIDFEYYPAFPQAQGTYQLWSSGQVALKVATCGSNNSGQVIFKFGNRQITNNLKLYSYAWYHFNCLWREGRMLLALDGRNLFSNDVSALPVGDTVTFGGPDKLAPEGLLRRIALRHPASSREIPPVQIIPAAADPEAAVKVVVNDSSSTSFDYCSPRAPSRIIMRPVMPVKPGQLFFVDITTLPPFELTAVKSGELEFNLPQALHCRVLVRPDTCGNLLRNGSFEQTSDTNFTADWLTTITFDNAPNRTFNFEPPLAVTPEFPFVAGADTAAVDAKTCRSGKSALRVEKLARRSVVAVSQSNLQVIPGGKYLWSGYYHVERMQWATGFFAEAEIYADGVKNASFTDNYQSPALYCAPGQWRFFERVFDIPDLKTNKVTVTVKLVVDGAPGLIYFDDLDLRPFPAAALQLPLEADVKNKEPQEGFTELEKLLQNLRPVQPLVSDAGQYMNLKLNNQSVPFLGTVLLHGNAGHRVMAEAGINLQWASLDANHLFPEIWTADGCFNFTAIDERLRQIVSFAPNSVIGIYLYVEPYYNFGQVHPESAWIDSNGKPLTLPQPRQGMYPERQGKNYNRISYISAAFQREAGAFMSALGRHLAETPYGKSVAAIHVAGGSDGQWFNWPLHYDFCLDRSPGTLETLSVKIKEQYKGDTAALRKAWGNPELTFDTIAIPPAPDWHRDQVLRDPVNPAHRQLIDLETAYTEAVVESVGRLAAAFEKGFGRPVLKSMYYYGDNQAALLNSSNFNGFVSVPPYGETRPLGRSSRLNQPAGSAQLHGKYFLNELDHRTEYSVFFSRLSAGYDYRRYGTVNGVEDYANQMRKELGAALTAGQSAWFYGLGGDLSWAGAYTPVIREAVSAVKARQLPLIQDDWGETAVFSDERAQAYMSTYLGTALQHYGLVKIQEPLYQSGIAWQNYLLSDLEHPKRPAARLNIFALASSLTEPQIDWIEKNLHQNGMVSVFIFDAGRVAPGGFEKNIRRLTGITVKARPDQAVQARLSAARFPDRLSKALGTESHSLSSRFQQPLFYVDDREATPLALFDGTKLVAGAVRRHADWTAVYLAVPGGFAFSPEFIRTLAGEAGVQPVGPAGDTTYSGGGYLVLHAHSPGTKNLAWTGKADLLDLTTGQIVARNTEIFSMSMKFGETRWFCRLTPAQILPRYFQNLKSLWSNENDQPKPRVNKGQ